MATVLFVGCHPDDIELGCAGIVCESLAAGHDVTCVFLTRGECSGDPSVRVRESRTALAGLGVAAGSIVFGDFLDTHIPDSKETISFIESLITEDTHMAFVPSEFDTHQDHRHAAIAAITGLRDLSRLLAYESPSTTVGFRPNTFLNIEPHIRAKWQSLLCHRSQIERQKTYMEYESMLSLAAFRGRQAVGLKYAESFVTLRSLLTMPLLRTG